MGDSFIDRANFSIILGLVCLAIGILTITEKPNYLEKKNKKTDYLKNGFKLMKYNTSQGFIFLGCCLIIFAIYFYIKSLI